MAGLVLQDPDTQAVLARVGDDVGFACENLGVPRAEIPARVRRALDDAVARAWADQRVLIIESGHVWGDPELESVHADWFTRALHVAGFEAVVVAPVGVDDEAPGPARRHLEKRSWWTERRSPECSTRSRGTTRRTPG